MRIEWRRLLPGETDHETLWASVALALGVLFLAWVRFVEFPPVLCPFHVITGLPCPTCGATRALFAFVAGDPLEALRYNPMIGIGLCVAVPYFVYAAVVSIGRLPRLRIRMEEPARRYFRRAAWALIAATWLFLIADGR